MPILYYPEDDVPEEYFGEMYSKIKKYITGGNSLKPVNI